MKLEQFLNKWNSRGIDFDGHWGYQCVDLYRQFVKEVLGFPQSPGVVGAKDIWNTYLKEHYTRFNNTPLGVPQKGDIVVWNKNMGGGFGHVAIFLFGNVSKFVSFDQNFPAGSLCHFQSHNYKNISGWLRPKGVSFKEEFKPNDQTIIPKNLLKWPEDLEIQQIRGLLGDFMRLGTNYATLSKKYNELLNAPKEEPIFTNKFAKLFYSLAKHFEQRS